MGEEVEAAKSEGKKTFLDNNEGVVEDAVVSENLCPK